MKKEKSRVNRRKPKMRTKGKQIDVNMLFGDAKTILMIRLIS